MEGAAVELWTTEAAAKAANWAARAARSSTALASVAAAAWAAREARATEAEARKEDAK